MMRVLRALFGIYFFITLAEGAGHGSAAASPKRFATLGVGQASDKPKAATKTGPGLGLHSDITTKANSIKAELCPEVSGASRYTLWATRYDNTTEKCYMTGQKGPCGNNMIFYSVAGDGVYGECDCNYDIECRSLIYSSVYDECFLAYEQGHCNDGYWLVADKEGKPQCERNLCRPPPKYSLKYQWALYKGRCERLYQPLHDCKPGEHLWIPKGNRYPECGNSQCTPAHSFIPDLQCELGSKLFHEGRCTRRKGI